MSRHLADRILVHKTLLLYLLIALLIGVWPYLSPSVYGDKLGDRSLKISNSTVNEQAKYALSFTFSSAGTLGSIKIQFCSNDPFPGASCDAPSGFDASSASLTSQSGETGFSINGSSTANTIILSRTPSANAVVPASYTFDNITNPSSEGTYYVRLQTFAADDATGPVSDYGGLAFAINSLIRISVEVPPYLVFCTGIKIATFNCSSASGSYVKFGELSSKYTSSGSSQMMAATNAASGYGITMSGATMTSGNNTIKAMPSLDVSRPATSQFGLNLRANNDPVVGANVQGSGSGSVVTAYYKKNFYKFHSGDTVAGATGADEYRRYTISYIVNVSKNQSPGVYSSTVTYICLANF